MPFLEWPARSPDLKVIENMWGERAVYADGRQYSSVSKLKASIQRELARTFLTNNKTCTKTLNWGCGYYLVRD